MDAMTGSQFSRIEEKTYYNTSLNYARHGETVLEKLQHQFMICVDARWPYSGVCFKAVKKIRREVPNP
jgi:hypothetical protein